jgi:hypothetical protein
MNFVIVCSTLFRPGVGPDALRKVWQFLTQAMRKTQKSRIYCQLTLIEDAVKRGELATDLNAWERSIIDKVETRRALADEAPCTPKGKWALKNN